MLLDDVQARIAGKVTELPAERQQFAADLAELIRRDAMPNAPIAAYLLDGGTRAVGDGQSGAGYFIQAVEQRVVVVVIFNSAGDVSGGKVVTRADDLLERLKLGMVGWAPAGDAEHSYTTDFRFGGSDPAALTAGRAMYQLEFVIGLQLRILS